MRECNHRSVLLNRASITITSTIYDRRALDCHSDVPLINSLNHLTYLASNSAKVRETIATDGALERLVSILHGCYLPLHDLAFIEDRQHDSALLNVVKKKKLAVVAWKWTLAFQCLVLTGTRGTESIRKEVVKSGIIPILATVLDNYLIYNRNYDYFKDKKLDSDFASVRYLEFTQHLNEQEFGDSRGEMQSKDPDFKEFWQRERLRAFLGDDIPSFTQDKRGTSFKNCEPKISSLSCDVTQLMARFVSLPEFKDLAFDERLDDNIVISIPREFYFGRIVPKTDDVTWSLQLLAFISKYTYMKPHLQNTHLVDSLSFRRILERTEEPKALVFPKALTFDCLDLSPLNIEESSETRKTHDLQEEDPYLIEIRDLCTKPENKAQVELPNSNMFQDFIFHSMDKEKAEGNCKEGKGLTEWEKGRCHRMKREACMVESFEQNWDYNTVSKELDSQTWSNFVNSEILNLFPLVERFTAKKGNDRDMTYWSSVIMRNSCRKNEITGVRQCANFNCGKWEEYPKQFAKCRRCKRTKYCSRECQLKSWNYHRYWCQEVGSSSTGANTTVNATGANTPGGTATTTVGDNSMVSTATTTATTEGDQSILSTAHENITTPQRITNADTNTAADEENTTADENSF